jgi:hypothetical protein
LPAPLTTVNGASRAGPRRSIEGRCHTAAAAQRFLAAEIQHDVQTVREDVELTEGEILVELGRVRDQLDRLTAALETGRDAS